MKMRLTTHRLARVLAAGAFCGASLVATSGVVSASTHKLKAKQAVTDISFINCGPALSPVEGGVLLGAQLGYLKGATVVPTNSSGTGACVQSVATGGADISGPGLEPVVDALATGEKLNVKFFYETVRHEPFEFGVSATSSITQASQLKNAVIGVPTIGGIEEDYAVETLRSAGVDPSTVKFEAVGSSISALNAVQTGSIAALMISNNIWGQFKSLGGTFKTLPIPKTGLISQIPGASVVANGSWLAHHQRLAAAYVKGVTESLLFQFANPEAMADVFYTTYPQYMVPGKDLYQNIIASIPSFQSEPLAVWGWNNTHPLKNWGAFTGQQWRSLLSVDKESDPQTASLTYKDLLPYWTNSISKTIKISPADIKAIVKRALAWPVPKS